MKSEKKQTAINLVAKTFSFGTTMIISFFLTPFLVERIGKEAYSFYPLANNFVNYMSIITIALNSMASRFITIALTKGDEKKANTYFVSVLYGNVIISVALLVPLLLLVLFLEYILDIPIPFIPSVKLLFVLVFISMIVELITNVFGVAVFSQNRLELGSLCDIAVAILRVVLYAVFFLVFDPNIAYVGVVSVVVALATMLMRYHLTKKLLPTMKFSSKFFDWLSIKEILNSGIWNSVNQIGVTLMSTIGLMMCNRLYGATAGGDYSIALTIPHFLNGIVNMLSSVFMPGLTIKYARGNKAEIVRHVTVAQSIIGFVVNIPVAVFMAIGVNFFKLWTPSVDPNHLQRLSVLAIGYLLITGVAWPVSNLNTVMNKVKVPALVMVWTGVINIFSIYLTYKFTDLGVYGIPLGQMVLFILNRAIFVGVYSAHCLGVKWYTFYLPLVKGLLCAGISFILSFFVNRALNPSNWLELIAECICVGIVLVPLCTIIMLGKNTVAVFKDFLSKKMYN